MACQRAADKRGWIKKAAMEPEKKTTKEEGQQKEKDAVWWDEARTWESHNAHLKHKHDVRIYIHLPSDSKESRNYFLVEAQSIEQKRRAGSRMH